MIHLERISKDHQKIEFIDRFIKYLPEKRISYLFGSATWRLELDEFDETKNDIDLVLDAKYIAADKEFIIDLCHTLSLEMTKYELVGKNTNYGYICISGDIQHAIVVINGCLKFDLIYTDFVDKFIDQLADVDIGMLIYSFSASKYIVGGQPSTLTVDKIFECAREKKITVSTSCQYIQTSLSRLIKLLGKGFTIDSDTQDSELAQTIMTIFCRSFYLPSDHQYDLEKCPSYYFHDLCTCRKNDLKFVDDDTYKLIKKFYLMYIALYDRMSPNLNHKYAIIGKMIAYALCMGDNTFARSELAHFHHTVHTFRTIYLPYVPMLLRRANSFELTMCFLNDLFRWTKFAKPIYYSCYFHPRSIHRALIMDAFYAEDYKYCEKLMARDDRFNLKYINHIADAQWNDSKLVKDFPRLCAMQSEFISDKDCESLICTGNVVIGELFNRYLKIKGLIPYKFINDTHQHGTHKYVHGHNMDEIPFSPRKICSAGGLYFSDHKNILHFAKFGSKLCRVHIYPHSLIYVEGDKYKTDQFYLDLDNHITIEQFLCDKSNAAFVPYFVYGCNPYNCMNYISPERITDELCQYFSQILSPYLIKQFTGYKNFRIFGDVVAKWTPQQIVNVFKSDFRAFSMIPSYILTEELCTLFVAQICADDPAYTRDCCEIVRWSVEKVQSNPELDWPSRFLKNLKDSIFYKI